MHCNIRLRIANGSELGIGPGIVELLERTAKIGSVAKAADEMGMSISKAWKILKKTEGGCGRKLLESSSGGSGGGASSLSPYAQKLIEVFREVEIATYKTAEDKLKKLESQLE